MLHRGLDTLGKLRENEKHVRVARGKEWKKGKERKEKEKERERKGKENDEQLTSD